jgi:hypothetical protein
MKVPYRPALILLSRLTIVIHRKGGGYTYEDDEQF